LEGYKINEQRRINEMSERMNESQPVIRKKTILEHAMEELDPDVSDAQYSEEFVTETRKRPVFNDNG
jgi:hypothetical protein